VPLSSQPLLASNEQLSKQQQLSWQQFIQQHPNSFQHLNSTQLADFQQAITLSDFVLSSAIQAPELVLTLFSSGDVYQQTMPDYQVLLAEQLVACQDEAQLHKQLRLFRLQQMVNIAVGDLVLAKTLDTSLAALSALADALILASVAWLSQFCQQKWGVPFNQENEEQPLLVYGMGKLGGKELNFSSDIDLIFVYPEGGETRGCRRSLDNQQFFTRLAQKVIAALHQHTADGFVYRVDMRLRPFGESGPLVLNFNAMEDYYQEQGRDWERYAMLKARLIGEGKYHQILSLLLRPFVYRRYIDFSVIDSLRRMKMMISQEVRRKQLVNNIKLGAGGIREIEFIVQVFQLIRGGRVTSLQQRNLLTVLPKLVTAGEINQATKDILEDAYRFLRRVENIIQALADKQTQTLPNDSLDQNRLIAVLGFGCWQDFILELAQHMANVHQQFKQLIGEESPNHHSENQHWHTLWHSQWSDEESIAWLEQDNNERGEQSYWHSEKVWRLLADFRADISKRSIGNRGRQVLDKLIPQLLCLMQAAKQTEVVLARVLQVFKKIVSRTAYIELLFENEGALKQLIHLCKASNWVTDYIAKHPILLDELIDPTLLHNPRPLCEYTQELREAMLRIPEEDLEAQMEALRLFKQAQQLRIAAADISGVLDVDSVSEHLTALAEAIINEVINLAWQQVSARFGVPTSTLASHDKGFGVIAYGKTGGKELNYGSDLDLVFVHTSTKDELTTGLANGDKVVAATQFYIKLAQRIMHIFNTRMNSGLLYELDLRLRPSGNSGVLVMHIDTFGRYQQQDAWTWEHQALVRARLISGNKQLNIAFKHIRQQTITQQRDLPTLQLEVNKMRDKMRAHLDKSTPQLLDLKQGRGGMVDIEFLAQYLVLAHGSEHQAIAANSDNLTIFNQLVEEDVITEQELRVLTTSYQQLRVFSHQAILQNEPLLIAKAGIVFSDRVTEIWNKYLPV